MNVLQFKKKSKDKSANVLFSSSEIKMLPPEVSAIGIDLGTTNSVVSVFSYGATHPVTLKYEDTLLVPSMVYFDSENNIDFFARMNGR